MGEGEALLRGVGIGNFWLSKSRGGGGVRAFPSVIMNKRAMMALENAIEKNNIK